MTSFLARLRSHLTYANVMASLAVLFALTGTAYATAVVTGSNVRDGSLTGADVADRSLSGSDLASGSVGGREIGDGSLSGYDVANGSLTGRDIHDGSVRSSDVRNGSLGGEDVRNGSLLRQDFAAGQLGSQRAWRYARTSTFAGLTRTLQTVARVRIPAGSYELTGDVQADNSNPAPSSVDCRLIGSGGRELQTRQQDVFSHAAFTVATAVRFRAAATVRLECKRLTAADTVDLPAASLTAVTLDRVSVQNG